MTAILLAALSLAPAQPASDKHEDQNPLFKRLTTDGLDVGGKAKTKFVTPVLPDGLDGAKQTAIIKELIKADYAYDEFTRDSVVGPQLLKIGDVADSDKKTPGRTVDVYFIAYGEFKRLEDDKFLDKLLSSAKGSSGGKGGPLEAKDLAPRKIEIKKEDEKRESYGTVEFDFLEKVRLNATGHAMWSRNKESVLAAAEIDPRFLGDKDFPNQWRSIVKEGGQVKIGEPNPWSGAAMYVKVTKLAEPAGAMFVEQHVVFTEPAGWFGGENLLRSKLPLAVPQNVRTMRQEFKKK